MGVGMATALSLCVARRNIQSQVARRGTRLRGTPTWRSQRWVLVQRFAGSTNDDDTDHRWSRKIRHSPGGEAPAGQWREAARMNSCLPTEALGIGVAGADTVLGFGKYGDPTYKEVLRRDPSYCEGVVVRAADGSGMDDEFLAFAKFVVEAKAMHASNSMEIVGGHASDIGVRDIAQCDTSHSSLDLEEVHTSLDLEEVQVGKYVGSTFAEPFDEDQEYCSMLVEDMMKQGKRGSPLWPLVAYILYRRQVGMERMP